MTEAMKHLGNLLPRNHQHNKNFLRSYFFVLFTWYLYFIHNYILYFPFVLVSVFLGVGGRMILKRQTKVNSQVCSFPNHLCSHLASQQSSSQSSSSFSLFSTSSSSYLLCEVAQHCVFAIQWSCFPIVIFRLEPNPLESFQPIIILFANRISVIWQLCWYVHLVFCSCICTCCVFRYICLSLFNQLSLKPSLWLTFQLNSFWPQLCHWLEHPAWKSNSATGWLDLLQLNLQNYEKM